MYVNVWEPSGWQNCDFLINQIYSLYSLWALMCRASSESLPVLFLTVSNNYNPCRRFVSATWSCSYVSVQRSSVCIRSAEELVYWTWWSWEVKVVSFTWKETVSSLLLTFSVQLLIQTEHDGMVLVLEMMTDYKYVGLRLKMYLMFL